MLIKMYFLFHHLWKSTRYTHPLNLCPAHCTHQSYSNYTQPCKVPPLTANPDQEHQCPAQRVHAAAPCYVLGSGGDRGWSHASVTLATSTMGLLTLLADCFPGTGRVSPGSINTPGSHGDGQLVTTLTVSTYISQYYIYIHSRIMSVVSDQAER